MKKSIAGLMVLSIVLLFTAVVSAAPKIKGATVDYKAGGMTMKGYLAYDENIKGKRPGVLVVHEWWGQNEYARKRARMLAELGYTALAVDMYGEGKTATHPDDAVKFSSQTMKNFPVAKERFEAAMAFLKKQRTVDPARIAAVGYCFGGGVVLNMARQGEDLKAVASFHGGLAAVKPATTGKVKAKIRVYNGEDDKFSPQLVTDAFMQEMRDAKVDFQLINYPGAVHSFTNPDADELGKKFGLPMAYNAEADKRSWADMTDFFAEVFKK
jgi:dienelactone hydrolase